jgi:fatty acid desaturase
LPQPNRRQWLLIASAALCYLIGYPLALIGHWAIGWLFVGLGGVVLIVLAAVTIDRVHKGDTDMDGEESVSQ